MRQRLEEACNCSRALAWFWPASGICHRVPGTGSLLSTTRLCLWVTPVSALFRQAGQGELCRVLHGVLDLFGLLQPGGAAPLPPAAESLRQLRPGQAGLGAARSGEPVQGESCWAATGSAWSRLWTPCWRDRCRRVCLTTGGRGGGSARGPGVHNYSLLSFINGPVESWTPAHAGRF